MIIVLDTNIILSALIKDSMTRRILIESGWDFYYPALSVEEIKEHRDLVLEKSGMTKEEFYGLVYALFNCIQIVPQENIKEQLLKAKELIGERDPDDVVFIASALSLNCVIWSDDKDFQEQKTVRIYTTKEITRLFLGV